MQIDERVPAVQLHKDQDILTTFIVRGPGHSSKVPGHSATPGTIRQANFGKNVASPLLVVEWAERGGRRTGVKSLHLSSEEEKRGSRFLRDLYAEEGRMDDYAAFLRHAKAAADGRKVAPVPDEYLPKQLLAWRAAEIAGESVFELPPKAAAEKPVVRRRESE